MTTDGQNVNGRNQRPRVTLMIPEQNAYQDNLNAIQPQPSPYAVTANTAGNSSVNQPNWPNPFMQHLYSQRAGDFVFKQFEGLNRFTKGGLSVGEKSVVWLYAKFRAWSRKWFTHCFLFIVMALYTVGGAYIFTKTEGKFEEQHLENVRKHRTEVATFARELWDPENTNKDSAKFEGQLRQKLGEFEEKLYEAFKKGQYENAELTPTWTFWNAMFFCGTIYTTIGYGHISPVTRFGRSLTIVYAIIGIPLFLILLTDFGKLFTRVIKFLWVFVRRCYYTGSLRKVRKTVPAKDMMRGLNVMYDFMRRPSMAFDPRVMAMQQQMETASPALGVPPPNESPMTPLPENLENYEIDDEFNLPISVAIIMLLTYMFFGASIHCMWENWSFFESFYFVFISISTIGFGDFIPSTGWHMVISIVYLVFGLALTSMCINVVQLKLSDHFRQASSKIIGLQMAEAASQNSAPQSPSDLQSVHSTPADNNGTLRPTNGDATTDKNTVNTNSKML